MLIIVLTVALLAALLAVIVLKNRYDKWFDPGLWWAGVVVVGVLLLIELGMLVDTRTFDFKKTEIKYAVLVEQVDNARNEGIATDAVLLKEIVEMNSEIDRHKVFVANPWTSWYFSKDIANYPKLKLNDKTL